MHNEEGVLKSWWLVLVIWYVVYDIQAMLTFCCYPEIRIILFAVVFTSMYIMMREEGLGDL